MSSDNIKDVEIIEDSAVVPVKVNAVDIEFEYARSNILKIIETSKTVLDTTAELAIESEHPRVIEVYANLAKNLSDINMNLFEIRKKKMELKGEIVTPDEVPAQNVTNHNAIFVGSTEDLLESLKNSKE